MKVSRGELTCTCCGETFHERGICPRCGLTDKGERRTELPPSVPTVTYLREGEWEAA